jgi:hypothetical protein
VRKKSLTCRIASVNRSRLTGLVGLGQHRTGAARALLFGSAAGVLFALQAAVTKVFVTQLGHGVAALLGDWTTYALIVSAIAGFVI